MSPLKLTVELIGHSMSILTFLGMAVYVTLRRSTLRRTVRRASIVYWLIVSASLFFSLINAFRMVQLLLGTSNSPLPELVDLLAEYPSITAQSLIILTIISLKVIVEPKSGQKRVLAIGAHPDDIEIACGGTLAKLHDAGYRIRGLVMTQGEQGGNAETRPEEARRGASFLGLDRLQIEHFTDTRLQEQPRDLLAAIETAIRDFQPDIILTHSSHDQHQDHQAVHEATLRAGRNHSTILCYESPSVTQDFSPSIFVDIDNYVDVKIESIREHWGQRDKPYVDPEQMRGIALFRGGQAKVHVAEGFEVVRALSSSFGEV